MFNDWACDADNHFFEPRDAFSRHIERKYADLAIRPIDPTGATSDLYIRDRKLYSSSPAKFDVTEPPGSLKAILRSKELTSYYSARSSEHMLPEFRDRAARLRLMDTQRLEKALMLPSYGVMFEWETSQYNLDALYANLRSLNRYIEEDWGFRYENRIFGVPLVSLFDIDQAVAEAKRLIDAGAVCLNLRAGPVNGKAPSHPDFDPFWRLVNEAGVLVSFHVGDSGHNEFFSAAWGEAPRVTPREISAFQWAFGHGDAAIMQTLGACVFQNLFGRFPNLKILSIENGSGWIRYFLRIIDKSAKMGRFGPWIGGTLDERPSNIIRRHVAVTPYHEDDAVDLVKLIGAENVLFGSDYPHSEGLAEPLEFAEGLNGLDDNEQRLIMRDNLFALLAKATAA